MKGNEQIMDRLNQRLADELTAISQYMVHSEMCANWGYTKLHAAVEKRAIDEMKHAEKLIERILFLEGKPIVSKLNKLTIGSTLELQLKNDLIAEQEAVMLYNSDITAAAQLGDSGTKMLFEEILRDEEAHMDWLETQLDLVSHLGLPVYLSQQLG